MTKGCIYKRGNIWWIKYYHRGKPICESAKSPDRRAAEKLSLQREIEAEQDKLPERQDIKIKAFITQIATVAIDKLQNAADFLDIDIEVINQVARPIEFIQHQGIYFFVSDGKIIYVGQSTNAIGRVMAHTKAQWYKDALSKSIRVCYLPVSESLYLNFVESWYIRKFKPIGNKHTGPVGGRYLKDFLIRYLGKNLKQDERLTKLVDTFIE